MREIATKQKLAAVLRERGLTVMARRAERGYYDDYESDLVAPINQLVADLRAHGAEDLAKRAIDGEWDGSREEGEAWFAREGKQLLEGEINAGE